MRWWSLAFGVGACALAGCMKRPTVGYLPPPPPPQPVEVRQPPAMLPPAATPSEAASGEKYRDYGVRGFVETAADRLSTFSVDVDTASYALVRRMLEQSYLPPREAVRLEEFVNYLPYDYAPPEHDPFSVRFDAAPSPFDPSITLLRVGLQGRQLTEVQRKPAHLTFLVDVSGSMSSEDKLGLVQQSLKMLAEQMRDGDTIAIATYAGTEKIVLQPTGPEGRDLVMAALSDLTPEGSTAMASGIELAYQLAEQSRVDGHVNRVVVCSDGDANVGSTSPEEILETIRAHADRGITLTTLGFGSGNYNDIMMERLADSGDGSYHYIDTRREAWRVLVHNVASTLEVIARDVKIQVEFDPEGVSDYRLLGYENRDIADGDFRNDAVDAGEIGAGHQVTALYELHLAPQARGRLLQVRVRNEAPGPESPAVEREFSFDLASVRPAFAEAEADTRVALAAAAFAEKLRGSPLSDASYVEIAELARAAARQDVPEDAELVRLIELAGQLAGERVANR